MTGFELFGRTASAVRSAKALQAYIHGGELTDALKGVGDVHSKSAIDHLRQAELSRNLREHLFQAAADMQTAYFAYEASTSRGPQELRKMFDSSWEKSRSKACGASAVVAALYFSVSESPEVIRLWVNRTAEQLTQYAISLTSNSQYGEYGAIFEYDYHSYKYHQILTDVIVQYLVFEASLLPSEFMRPMPLAFRPGGAASRHVPKELLAPYEPLSEEEQQWVNPRSPTFCRSARGHTLWNEADWLPKYSADA